MLGTWIADWLLVYGILAWQSETPDRFSATLRFILLAFTLGAVLGSAFSGYALAAGWRRVAAAWPEAPGALPLQNTDTARKARAFSLLSDPLGFLLQLVTVVPLAALCLFAILGAFLVQPILGGLALAILPILPLSVGASLESPQRRAAEPDRPRRRFRFRLAAYAAVIAPAWLLALATLGGAYLGVRSVAWGAAPLILLPAIVSFLFCIAWVAGAGALLEARSRAEAAVFD